MLLYPSAIDLSSTTLRYVADVLRAHHKAAGTRWRKLAAHEQALLVLVFLRNGDTYARLAAGFGIGVATVYRYIRETTRLLAARAPSLTAALWRLAWTFTNFAILDGTVIRTDRIAANRPFYSGKHRYHGINLQGLTDPHGNLIWISSGIPAGLVNDTSAARIHHIPELADQAEILLLADRGYHQIAEGVITPYKSWYGKLTESYLEANTAHARIRCQGERGFATLKNWHVLDRVRCCPHQVGTLAQAILALQHEAG
ncbi:transposase family protein [Saccharopolyspora sp. NPDC002686]|uniref:transposase family protein n=1 Tax=Saccharopolyspora sp. NPDC002686 TaxID=3154541 RepID=UPI0033203685